MKMGLSNYSLRNQYVPLNSIDSSVDFLPWIWTQLYISWPIDYIIQRMLGRERLGKMKFNLNA